jgi:prepilin-type N-terminal cleavage/methylation domain-containing protein
MRKRQVRLRGMTLVEMVITAFVLGLLLLIAAEGTEYVRNQLKTARTWETLARLDEAMSAYYGATGQWPEAMAQRPDGSRGREVQRETPGRENKGKEGKAGKWRGAQTDEGIKRQAEGEQAARRVLQALRAAAGSREFVERILAEAAEASADAVICDAWGSPFRCLTAQSESAVDRQAVAAHGGRPIFISSSPEGDLRSDERPR